MKKELNLAHSLFDFGYDGGEDCDEFVGFLDERFRFLSGENAASYKQVEPIIGFIQLLQDGLEFVDDVRIGLRAIPFTVVRADGCARTQDLFAKNLSLRCLWQT